MVLIKTMQAGTCSLSKRNSTSIVKFSVVYNGWFGFRSRSDGSSALSDPFSSMERPKVPDRRRKHTDVQERRVGSTRVENDELINQLLKGTNLTADESAEGLLYIIV